MKLIPIKTERVDINPENSIAEWVVNQMKRNDQFLQENDILVITSKVVSYFERRIAVLKNIKPTNKALAIEKKAGIKSQLIQLILNEADKIIAETKWVMLTRKNGIYCANAGIDTSNVPKGKAVIWPKDPFESARKIKESIKTRSGIEKFSIIITDSVCIPGRKGAIAIAIGYSGLEGFQELKGTTDLFKNTLKYSSLNIVDSLATSANLLMGEGSESTPMTIIRDYEYSKTEETKNDEMKIPPSDEMFPLG